MGEYTPTGKEEVLAEYTQYGIEGQHYTASNARDIAGYVKVPVVNSAQKATLGSLTIVQLAHAEWNYMEMRVSIL